MAALRKKSQRIARVNGRINRSETIDKLEDTYWKITRLKEKLLGISGLMKKTGSDETGYFDLDPTLNGVGEILEGYATNLDEYASVIDEQVVVLANPKKRRSEQL